MTLMSPFSCCFKMFQFLKFLLLFCYSSALWEEELGCRKEETLLPEVQYHAVVTTISLPVPCFTPPPSLLFSFTPLGLYSLSVPWAWASTAAILFSVHVCLLLMLGNDPELHTAENNSLLISLHSAYTYAIKLHCFFLSSANGKHGA